MPKKNYTVEAVTKRTILDPRGRMQAVYEVIFVTETGVRDTVEIAEKDYAPEKVAKLLDELTIAHDAVMKLGE